MSEMLSKAILIATNAHAGQFDKGGSPYIMHCIKVTHYTHSTDPEILAIAMLHDVIEDTDVTYKDFRVFGMSERVIEGVRALTKVPGESYEGYKARVKMNPDSRIVKMADLRHNCDIRRLKDVTQKDIARVAKYHKFYLELKAV